MNIGQAAKASGVSAKMIRYYESISLIPKAGRTDAGYRVYTDEDVRTLRFIHRAREFGFPVDRIRVLVGLWQDGQPSREVKRVALDHVAELDRRIAELAAMRDALRDLADACNGDHRPECPILRDLEDRGRPAVGHAAHPADRSTAMEMVLTRSRAGHAPAPHAHTSVPPKARH